MLFRYTANLAAHLTTTFASIEYQSIKHLLNSGIPIYIKDDFLARLVTNDKNDHSQDLGRICMCIQVVSRIDLQLNYWSHMAGYEPYDNSGITWSNIFQYFWCHFFFCKRDYTEARFKVAFDEIVKNDRFWRVKDDILPLLRGGNAVFAVSTEIQTALSGDCSLHVKMMKPLGTTQAGLVMTKNHPLLPNITRQIMKYLNDGTVIRIAERYLETCPVKSAWSLLPRANLENMQGLLVVTASVAVLTMGLGLIESHFLKCARRDKIDSER